MKINKANFMVGQQLMKVGINGKIIKHCNDISSKFKTFLPVIP